MASRHEFEAGGFDINPSIEDLGLAKHPEAITEKHDRGELENSDGVLGEPVVEGLW